MKLAIAGFGWWGRHIVTRLKDHNHLDVVLVVEPNEELHDEIGSLGLHFTANFEAALSDPAVDAVVLTTPHMFHEEQVVACANSGKDVFCEKPLGITAASARRSADACREAGVILGIGHERRFEPAMQKLKRMIDEGALGTLMHVEAAFSHGKLIGVPSGSWRTSAKDSPGAGMTGMGIHLTDLMIWMFGPVAEVQAQTRQRILDWETGDMVVAQLGFSSGQTGQLQAILATPHFMRFHVFGSKRWVEIRNGTHPDTPGGVTEFIVAESGEAPVSEEIAWSDSVVSNLEAFSSAVSGTSVYPWTDDQLIHNIELYEAIVTSANSGETVSLSQLR